jgi:hypothetical protein
MFLQLRVALLIGYECRVCLWCSMKPQNHSGYNTKLLSLWIYCESRPSIPPSNQYFSLAHEPYSTNMSLHNPVSKVTAYGWTTVVRFPASVFLIAITYMQPSLVSNGYWRSSGGGKAAAAWSYLFTFIMPGLKRVKLYSYYSY